MIISQIKNNQIEIIDTDNDTRDFFSYNTHIANYDGKTKKLSLTNAWDYSQTTLKYLYIFLRDNCIMPELDKVANKKAHIQHLLDLGEILKI